MTKYKVVLVPFPFDDLSASKVRPAVCLTDPIGSHKHIVLAFITSRVASAPLLSDIVINQTDADFAVTGLRVDSTLQTHRLMTVTTAIIKRELGQLPPRIQNQVRICLSTLFL